MAKFAIGNICIVHNLTQYTPFNGKEVTVVDIIGEESVAVAYFAGYIPSICTYYVCDDGFYYAEYNLKKKPFKGEENIMKLFTSLDNSGKIEADKLIEEEIV